MKMNKKNIVLMTIAAIVGIIISVGAAFLYMSVIG